MVGNCQEKMLLEIAKAVRHYQHQKLLIIDLIYLNKRLTRQIIWKFYNEKLNNNNKNKKNKFKLNRILNNNQDHNQRIQIEMKMRNRNQKKNKI